MDKKKRKKSTELKGKPKNTSSRRQAFFPMTIEKQDPRSYTQTKKGGKDADPKSKNGTKTVDH